MDEQAEWAHDTWAQDTRDTPPVIKAHGYVFASSELLMDAGVIPDTRPPRPPLPWRLSARRRVNRWRESMARRAYKAIAGYHVPDPEEW